MFSTRTNYDNRTRYLNPLYPEDKAMTNKPVETWVQVAINNQYEYEAGDEEFRRFWFRDVMRFLRRKLRTDGQIWLPEGVLYCKVWFEPRKSTTSLP